MFEANPENTIGVERAWKVLAGLARGDLVPHDKLRELLGVGDDDNRYYALMERLRKRGLREKGVYLENVPMVGYAWADVRRQLSEPEIRSRRARRQIKKAVVAIDVLPIEECSFPEQRQKSGLQERLALQVRQSNEEIQRYAFIMRPKDTQPRIVRDDPESKSDAGVA